MHEKEGRTIRGKEKEIEKRNKGTDGKNEGQNTGKIDGSKSSGNKCAHILNFANKFALCTLLFFDEEKVDLVPDSLWI
jgi:hypothetical protein